MRTWFKIVLSTCMLTVPLTLVFCSSSRHHTKHEFFRMSTMVDVTVSSEKGEAELQALWKSIDSLLLFWENHYSQTNELSEVRALNARKTAVRPLSKRLGDMMADALAYGDTTSGMFDPTLFPVKELWGLGEVNHVHRIPTSDTLELVLKHVDFRKVSLNPGHDTLLLADTAITIDAGGFAKGYALIETARLLDARGFSDYLVAAGDVVARGRRSDGKSWRIGIQHPRNNGLIATVQFERGAIFTSGDYENFWMDGTRRIHHIFNPETGCSCTNNQSVTIEGPSALQAKYLSTGLFCLPADSIVSFAERRGLNCFVIDSTGTIFMSSGWKKKVSIVKS